MKPHILFLCTGNSARSILAEATLRAWAGERFRVSSAGSRPVGAVNPLALAQLEAAGIACDGLRSKSWDEFGSDGAAEVDVLISVCDAAAAEACPVAFGDFVRSHWGLPDPAAVVGDEATQRQAFAAAHALIGQRLRAPLQLPTTVWQERPALQKALDAIGQRSNGAAGND